MATSNIDNKPLNPVFNEDELYCPNEQTSIKFMQMMRKNADDIARKIIFSILWENYYSPSQIEINFNDLSDVTTSYNLFLTTARQNNPDPKKKKSSTAIPMGGLNEKLTTSSVLSAGSIDLNDLMNQLIRELQAELSNYVWMGLGRNRKHKALERLLNSNETIESKYQELIKITTTQRTRFGLFYYVERTNSSTTNTALDLSKKLVESKYAGLKTALSINANTAAELRQQFNTEIGAIDFYTQEPTKFSIH